MERGQHVSLLNSPTKRRMSNRHITKKEVLAPGLMAATNRELNIRCHLIDGSGREGESDVCRFTDRHEVIGTCKHLVEH